VPLAVSALEVALASVIVTAVTAVFGPLITWQIAKSGRDHERAVDLSRRNYEARREVYVEMLALTRVKVQALAAAKGHAEKPTWPDSDERRTLFARITAFGSTDVAEALNDFDLLWEGMWTLMESIPSEDRSKLPVDELQKIQEKLGDLVRDELTR